MRVSPARRSINARGLFGTDDVRKSSKTRVQAGVTLPLVVSTWTMVGRRTDSGASTGGRPAVAASN